ncbi:thermonuclease family protein [Enterovirga rhinocerotis]|uniref:thermonuclease family protein n=1 Tax=Enterovirga rhinocerotis TaxID=1339210 RepID=UPI00105E11EF|nr:thermonuclease family protein [Enterovirga rhinocerotis]
MTALTIVGLLFGLASVLRGERLEGSPVVIDGDTLLVAGRRIRLKGMDAPELRQTCERDRARYPCGEEARMALRALISGRPVACLGGSRDRFERLLATCSVGDIDLGAEMVRRGLAVAYGAYDAEERAAREARVGLWAGTFERPADWRRRHEPRSPSA